MLLGHVDTVWPRGTLRQRPFRVEDGRAYGPGVFDMKSGVAVMLAALEAIAELDLPRPHPVKVLLSCDEESGSPTSRDLIEARSAGSAPRCSCLEPPLPGGAAKTERKGVARYELIARGVSAHAGLDPEQGIQRHRRAGASGARAATGSNDLDGVSVNVGVIRGGTVVNVVAAEARAEIDVRFRHLGAGARGQRTVSPRSRRCSRRALGGPGRSRPPAAGADGRRGVALCAERARSRQSWDSSSARAAPAAAATATSPPRLGVPTPRRARRRRRRRPRRARAHPAQRPAASRRAAHCSRHPPLGGRRPNDAMPTPAADRLRGTESMCNLLIRAIAASTRSSGSRSCRSRVWGMHGSRHRAADRAGGGQGGGGQLIGAFDGEALVGFVYGFVAMERGRTVHHSHLLGVKPSYRSARRRLPAQAGAAGARAGSGHRPT